MALTSSPRWATFALIDNEKFEGDVWECACGDGAMSKVFEEAGSTVFSSDLYDRGYGEIGLNFLAPTRSADNIVTNPPYNCAEGFVASGVKHANRKFALLLRLAFLEGAHRANTIFAHTPPSRVWVFSERITFYPKGVAPQGSGTTAYELLPVSRTPSLGVMMEPEVGYGTTAIWTRVQA